MSLCFTAVAYFLFYRLLFSDRLEQRDLRTYQTDFHRIFMVGRHVAVDVQSGICFAIDQGTLPWQPISGAKSAEIGDMPSFLRPAFHKGWQDGKTLTPLMSSLHRLRIW